jgi:phospholipase/carboxylesterase
MSVDADSQQGVSRRRFGALAGGAMVSLAFGGACHGSEAGQGSDGRIAARPRSGVTTSGSGSRALELGAGRDAVLQLPAKLSTAPLPLIVLLHGAGGAGAGILRRLGAVADEAGVAVLAPDSREGTWDVIRGGFGPDVTFLNRALERVFDTVAIDPARLSIGGFSDGASYALSIGLINGDLFQRIIAFSPGFVVDGSATGKPRIFISHGTADTILPIDRCSRAIVPRLRKRGYDIIFREFGGGHEVPPAIAREGMDLVVASSQSPVASSR